MADDEKKKEAETEQEATQSSPSSSSSPAWMAIMGNPIYAYGPLAEQSQVRDAEKWFDRFKKEVLDQNDAMDAIFRTTFHYTLHAWIRQFASFSILHRKDSLWLQLLLVDEDRKIQGTFYRLGQRVAFCLNRSHIVEDARKFFKEASGSLLEEDVGANHWVFSRSLFLPEFDGTVDKAIEFASFDALKPLMNFPKDDPSEVRCSQVFLFLAGDFPSQDGYHSRRSIVELLRELIKSEEAIEKLHASTLLPTPPERKGNRKLCFVSLQGFWAFAVSAKVSKHKLDEFKDVQIHIPVNS